MPWRETCPMDERMRFVLACEAGEESFSELCRGYGVSRKTGYKWLDRYRALGPVGLVDRSRAADCGAAGASALGAEEDPGLAGDAGACRGMAGGEHDRPHSGAGGPGDAAPAAAVHPRLWPAVCRLCGSERRLVHGLQRVVRHRLSSGWPPASPVG